MDLLTLPVGRTVMPWAAKQVLSGAATAAWLVQTLWPYHDRPDEALDHVIHQLDMAVEYAGNLREEAAAPTPRSLAVAASANAAGGAAEAR